MRAHFINLLIFQHVMKLQGKISQITAAKSVSFNDNHLHESTENFSQLHQINTITINALADMVINQPESCNKCNKTQNHPFTGGVAAAAGARVNAVVEPMHEDGRLCRIALLFTIKPRTAGIEPPAHAAFSVA